MASIGGVGGSGGSGGRHEMPVPLATALVLVHALFAVTVVGGLGLLMTAGAYDALDGQVIALVVYAAAPGVLGWWLARRSWEGGVRVRRGLLAVQGWLVLGGVVNLVSGSAREACNSSSRSSSCSSCPAPKAVTGTGSPNWTAWSAARSPCRG